MKSANMHPRSTTFKRTLACTMAVLLCAIAIISYAETQNTAEKHFSLEAATLEVSQDPNRPALTIKEIAKQTRPSIVGITTESTRTYSDPFGGFGGFGYGNGRRSAPQIRQSGAGSGIVLSTDGYILTNNHVVSDSDKILVYLTDGKEYEAALVGADAANDVAIIKINATDLTPATFGDSSQLEVGELAVAIGNPLGEVNGSVTAGIISALERTLTIDGNDMTLLQTDAAINPGNSGGALINSFGEVIGIVNAKTASVSVEGIGYAIPVNHVKALIEKLVNDGGGVQIAGSAANGPMLGVTVRDVDAALAKQYNVPEGVYVVDVEPFSAAEKAGIRIGDTILSLGGQEIKTLSDLNRIKVEVEQGVPHTMMVLRDGVQKELSITLNIVNQPTL